MTKSAKNILIGSAVAGVGGMYLINSSKPYNDLFEDRKMVGLALVGLSVLMTTSIIMSKGA